MFWGKYAKGDYRTMVHVSYLMRALPELQALRSAYAARLRHCYYHGLHARRGVLIRRGEGGLRGDAQEERDCDADAVH